MVDPGSTIFEITKGDTITPPGCADFGLADDEINRRRFGKRIGARLQVDERECAIGGRLRLNAHGVAGVRGAGERDNHSADGQLAGIVIGVVVRVDILEPRNAAHRDREVAKVEIRVLTGADNLIDFEIGILHAGRVERELQAANVGERKSARRGETGERYKN